MNGEAIHKRVDKWAAEHGLDPAALRSRYGPRSLGRERALLAYDLWVHGATNSEIGAELGGRARHTVTYWLHRARRERGQSVFSDTGDEPGTEQTEPA